ncbi:hypothetical protein GT347_08390 [Xylophilus rhododendri]|uniref:Uncharacterized protein n=1 Tax=Xylophilus rhododendri TaxID=2697032 RepID=A0A857J455_9BURK|nr:hypothetical protein [Xylophilus rhododendri]QHI98013.1 hypothetical protein GT347_08390 [Xylophilus rhododendri]
MHTPFTPQPVAPGRIPQPVLVVGAIVLFALSYNLASGNGAGRSLESDRLIVANCWKSIDKKDPNPAERRELSDVCARMERGLNLKYGSTY